MKTKIHKEETTDRVKRGEHKPKYHRPERQIRNVDLQRVEEAPLNEFEREVQRKIAVVPDARELLIAEEEKTLFREALESISFSDLEGKYLKLTVEGFTPTEIGKELGIRDTAVHWHLAKAIRKIRVFLSQKYGLSGRKTEKK